MDPSPWPVAQQAFVQEGWRRVHADDALQTVEEAGLRWAQALAT